MVVPCICGRRQQMKSSANPWYGMNGLFFGQFDRLPSAHFRESQTEWSWTWTRMERQVAPKRDKYNQFGFRNLGHQKWMSLYGWITTLHKPGKKPEIKGIPGIFHVNHSIPYELTYSSYIQPKVVRPFFLWAIHLNLDMLLGSSKTTCSEDPVWWVELPPRKIAIESLPCIQKLSMSDLQHTLAEKLCWVPHKI